MFSELERRIEEEYAPVSLESEERLLAEFEEQEGDEEALDADYDQAVFTLRKDRLANWTLLLAGLQTALAKTEQKRSIGLKDFRAILENLARQHPGITAFDVKAKSKILPTDAPRADPFVSAKGKPTPRHRQRARIACIAMLSRI